MRAATSQPSPEATPHSTEPTVKMMMAPRNTCRAPKWSATQPEAGMKTERLIR